MCALVLEERRMTHVEKTLINRPYGTRRVFFLFQALRARPPSQTTARLDSHSKNCLTCGRDVGLAESGYPRFNPSGINASLHLAAAIS